MGRQMANRLQGNHRKTAFLINQSVVAFIEKYGIERVGFLTLTFADHVISPKEAQRRFHSLKTHVLTKAYVAWIRVFERQQSSRIHYHVLVALKEDIRTGANFEAFNRGDYRSANGALRCQWAFWRRTAKAYRFGRTELLPVKSSKEAIAFYVGKYVAKHIHVRKAEDKGVRLVAGSRGAMVGTTRFAWNSPRAKLWRAKVAVTAAACGFSDLGDFSSAFGPRWAYCLQRQIIGVNLVTEHGGQYTYPNAATAEADGHHIPEDVPKGVWQSLLHLPVTVTRYLSVPLCEYPCEYPEHVQFGQGVRKYRLKSSSVFHHYRDPGQRHSQVWQTLQSAIVQRVRRRAPVRSWIAATARE